MKGRGGMGSHKHGVGGHAAVNSRYKASVLRDAEKLTNEQAEARKRFRPRLKPVKVRDLFNRR